MRRYLSRNMKKCQLCFSACTVKYLSIMSRFSQRQTPVWSTSQQHRRIVILAAPIYAAVNLIKYAYENLPFFIPSLLPPTK